MYKALDILNVSRVPNGFSGIVTDFLSDDHLTEFVVTAIATGTAVVADASSSDYASTLNGAVKFDNNASDDNSGAEIQLDAAPFGIEAYCELDLLALFKVTDADNFDGVLGFAALDTSWIAGVANAIQLRWDDDGVTDLAVIDNSATVAQTGLFSLADDTWTAVHLGIAGTGVAATVKISVDYATYDETNRVWTKRDAMESVEFTAAPVASSRGGLSVGMGYQSGGAADMQCYLDKLVAIQRRFPAMK